MATIYLIVVIGILNQIGFSGSRVAISLYALELGANQFTIGLIAALYSLCPLLLSIAIGRYADRIAPRTPMLVSCIGMGAMVLLPLAFPAIATLLVMGFVLGFLHQTFGIPLEALVGGIDGPDKRARNYALITVGWSIANFLGPVITGFSIDYMGHVQAFPVLAVFVAAPALILWIRPRLLPASAVQHAAKSHVSVADLWRIPGLRATFITGGIIGSAQDLFQFYFPIYGDALGISASAIGTILGTVALAAFAIRALVPVLLKRLSELDVLTYSIFVGAFAFVLLPFFSNPYALAMIAFVLGLGVGCAQPMVMSLIYLLAPKGRTAEGIGLYKAVRSSTHLLVPLVFGSVGTAFGFSWVFLSNAGLLGAGGWLMRRLRLTMKA